MKKDRNALVSKVNSFLSTAEQKWLTQNEAKETLKNLGLNMNIIRLLLPTFNKVRDGKTKKYMLPKCITLEQLNNAYATYYSYNKKLCSKKHNIDDNTLIAEAKSRGFGIIRILGFDEEAFSNDHPDLYKKYLKYEII